MIPDDVRVPELASALVARCGVRPGERVFVLTDDGTVATVTHAVIAAVHEAGATALPRAIPERTRVFADLPSELLDEILSPRLVLDLTSLPWLYSDSLTRYAREAGATGSRLALVLADRAGLATLLSALPDERLFARAEATVPRMNRATELTAHSAAGTEFRVRLAGEASFIGAPPVAPGSIGAPLYASVTAPFVPGTAEGVLVFRGAGRIQGPEVVPFTADEPVTIRVAGGT